MSEEKIELQVKDILDLIFHCLDTLGEKIKMTNIRQYAEDHEFYLNLFPEYKPDHDVIPDDQEVGKLQILPGKPSAHLTVPSPLNPMRKVALLGVVRIQDECPRCSVLKLRWFMHMDDDSYVRVCEKCGTFKWFRAGDIDFSEVNELVGQLYKAYRLMMTNPVDIGSWKSMRGLQ